MHITVDGDLFWRYEERDALRLYNYKQARTLTWTVFQFLPSSAARPSERRAGEAASSSEGGREGGSSQAQRQRIGRVILL